jgi:tRNA A37 threonylcarbamoyladenosine dehydratase
VVAKAAGEEPVEPAFDEQGVAEQLVAQAQSRGIELVGPDGLLSQLTKRVLVFRPGFVGGCVVYATSRSGVAVLACRW